MNRRSTEAWREVCRLDRAADGARGKFLDLAPDRVEVLRVALGNAMERAPALRTLAVLPENERRLLLPELVGLASMYISDITGVRTAIASFDRMWLSANLRPLVLRELGPHATYEQYRLLAELLLPLDSALLKDLVQLALANTDADILEVGRDFSTG